MSAFLLFVLFLLLTVISYQLFDFEIIHPAVIFCAFFSIALFTGLLNYTAWNFNLNAITAFVVGGGGVLFVLVCLIVKNIDRRFLGNKSPVSESKHTLSQLSTIRIPNWFALSNIVVSTIFLYFISKAMIIATAQYGSSGSVLSAISVANTVNKFSDQPIFLPVFETQAFVFLQAAAFIWIYVFIYNLVISHRFSSLVFINAFICGISPILSGSRGPIFLEIIFCIVVSILFLDSRFLNKNRSPSRLKTIFGLIVVFIVALVTFEPLLSLMGRTSDVQSINEYIAIYLGAPIKNLDIMISSDSRLSSFSDSSQWGEITFASLYLFFNKSRDASVTTNWATWFPFQTVNNQQLGNVYTVYYPLMRDWGLFGAAIGIVAIAVSAQIIFDLANRNIWSKVFPIRISYLFYSVIAYGVAFCFFSNWITSTIINTQFIRFLIVWILFSWTIGRFQLRSTEMNVISKSKVMQSTRIGVSADMSD